MPDEFGHGLNFGRLHAEHEPGEEVFTDDEVKQSENEPGRESLSAEALLSSERADPLVGNPYRPEIEPYLKQIDDQSTPRKAEKWLKQLMDVYDKKLVAARRLAEQNYYHGGANAHELQNDVKFLTQAVDWLRGYRKAKFADFKDDLREVAQQQDVELLQQREQGMLKDLRTLVEGDNDCALYVYLQCNQKHDALWQVIEMTADKVQAIREMLLTTMVDKWLGLQKEHELPQKLEQVHSVRSLIDSWFPPGSKTLK